MRGLLVASKILQLLVPSETFDIKFLSFPTFFIQDLISYGSLILWDHLPQKILGTSKVLKLFQYLDGCITSDLNIFITCFFKQKKKVNR